MYGGVRAGSARGAADSGGLLDECRDEAAALVGLRVPLDAEREAVARILDRLGKLVEVGPPGYHQPLAEPVDALVVMGLRGVALLPRRARGERPGRQAHVMVGAVEAPQDAPVVLVAEQLGQVLMQRPAARDVHDLHPAADAEQRQVALQRAPYEGDLERVAARVRLARQGMGQRTVGDGVDVGAAREHEPVETLERLVGIGDERVVGDEQQRRRARALNWIDIAAGQEVCVVPVLARGREAPARALARRADADYGTGHARTVFAAAGDRRRDSVPLMYDTIELEHADGAATIRLNRPAALNA